MIGVIDYGVGNVKAFLNVYERLGIKAKSITKIHDFENVTKLILPGVGAFDHAMNELNKSGLRNMLENSVCKKKIPILGICVGMQMLGNSSEEGHLPGLGWINGNVKKFNQNDITYKTRLPHMGWNTITPSVNNTLLKGFNENSRFYFLHSFFFDPNDIDVIIASTNYGKIFTSAINLENIFGVQFHPEKSHQTGVDLLRNFSLL
jgi:glutamine amidotransferase